MFTQTRYTLVYFAKLLRGVENLPMTCFSVFKRGLHCSLFEVVAEKNRSTENLTELFQKLEEEGLVCFKSVELACILVLINKLLD